MERTYTFQEGGIWEEKKFVIKIDNNVIYKDHHQCKHVKNGCLKAIVIGVNEGGYNSTGICLECIIEASKTIEELKDDIC